MQTINEVPEETRCSICSNELAIEDEETSCIQNIQILFPTFQNNEHRAQNEIGSLRILDQNIFSGFSEIKQDSSISFEQKYSRLPVKMAQLNLCKECCCNPETEKAFAEALRLLKKNSQKNHEHSNPTSLRNKENLIDEKEKKNKSTTYIKGIWETPPSSIPRITSQRRYDSLQTKNVTMPSRVSTKSIIKEETNFTNCKFSNNFEQKDYSQVSVDSFSKYDFENETPLSEFPLNRDSVKTEAFQYLFNKLKSEPLTKSEVLKVLDVFYQTQFSHYSIELRAHTLEKIDIGCLSYLIGLFGSPQTHAVKAAGLGLRDSQLLSLLEGLKKIPVQKLILSANSLTSKALMLIKCNKPPSLKYVYLGKNLIQPKRDKELIISLQKEVIVHV